MIQLKECSMELFEICGSYYAFDCDRLYFWKITRSIYTLLESVRKNRSFEKEKFNSKDIMQVMLKINKGYFFRDKPLPNSREFVNNNQLIISFPIVHSCNLRCKYCFAQSGEIYIGEKRILSINVVDKIIEFIQKRFHHIKRIRLEFVSGGETLLDKEKFFEIVPYFKKQIENKGYMLEIFLLTNGTTMDSEVLDRIEQLGVSLGISMDGPNEIHNYHRPLKSGDGSYDLVQDTVNMIKSHQRLKDKIWIVSVITAATPSLEEILNHNINMGVNSMEMRVVRGTDPKELSLNETTIEDFKKKYTEFANYLKENIMKVIYIINDFDTFGKIIRRMLLKIGVYYRCSAGVYKFSFTADGDIYACDSFVGHEKFKLGNVHENILDKDLLNQYKNLSVINCMPCQSCSYKFWCGGDCNFNAYCNNGSMNEKKSVFCALQVHLCKLAIDLIEYIRGNDKTSYNFLVKYVEKQSKKLYKNDCLGV